MELVIDTTADAAIRADGSYKVGNFNKGQLRGEVSQQWAFRPDDQRFLDLHSLHAHLKGVHDRSWEARPALTDIELIPGDMSDLETRYDFKIGVDGKELEPTHWSFGQLCSIAGAPANYMRRLPAELMADNLLYGLHANRPEEDGIKLWAGDGTLHAATSVSYGRIPDHQVVEAVMEVAGSGRGEKRWKVPGELNWQSMVYHPNIDITKDNTTLYASDRDFFIFLVDDRNPIAVGKLPSGEPDLMFRGFYVRGSSVGAYKQSVAAFYLRAVCMNRNLWGVEGFQEVDIIHNSNAPERWLDEVQPALLAYAEGSTEKLIDGVAAAKARKVAQDQEEATDFLMTRCAFSKKTAEAVLAVGETEEGVPPRTIWDMAQAITAFARTITHSDVRLTMELKAKKLLDRVL